MMVPVEVGKEVLHTCAVLGMYWSLTGATEEIQ